jgi:hypothetical protein
LVEFLNQRYDENGMPVCDEKSLADFFLYRPRLDGYVLQSGISKQELFGFYRETKKVHEEILGIAQGPGGLGACPPLPESEDAVPTFKASVYGLIHHVLHNGHLDLLGRCGWFSCGRFFVRADLRERYCSKDCYKKHDSQESGDRHLRRGDYV